MDQLFDTYKQIVDRAISLGLLSEDSKSYYLSACGEEAASDSTIKESNSCDIQVKHEKLQTNFENAHSLSRANSEELKQNLNLAIEFNAKKVQDEENAICKDQIPVASRSIENYSILDINNFIKMANSIGSDSELSDILKAAHNIYPGDSPAIKLNKVRRKPKKNEVVDFQIPIYLDINRKKVSTKSSKVKRHFSLHEKGRINIESSTLQNGDEKEPRNEKITNNRTFQAYKSKHCSKIPKLVNLTNNVKNTSKLRTCNSNTYEPDYKNIKQSILGTSSPIRKEKNSRPSRVVSTPPMRTYSKSRNDLKSPLRKDKSLTITKVKKENIVDHKERFPTTFQSFYERKPDGINNHGSKYTLFRSSNGRRLAFRSSPDVFESKNLTQLSSSDEYRFFKYATECKPFQKPDSPSDDSSWKGSADSEAKVRSSQKLLNLNIICQFFSSDSSGGKQDSASVESLSQSEQVENEKMVSIDSDAQPPKERCTRRSRAHFLSKLFSRSRMH
ncbi:hypothetical protein AVEN_219509-1 [Araneus ventricosus]|uniref:Uncharacterized protein n=1 Tax=Araneus ventricosus TaxID=182803 RepID=A0A4Y2BNX9_ARAVE|nr:hypothetical protein AVEN_219509-1 [Araneus ventricosus]